jgi:hypothetical protein
MQSIYIDVCQVLHLALDHLHLLQAHLDSRDCQQPSQVCLPLPP